MRRGFEDAQAEYFAMRYVTETVGKRKAISEQAGKTPEEINRLNKYDS